MDEWARSESGLIVPGRVTLAKKMEQAKAEAVARGRFFSNYAMTQSAAGPGLTKPDDTLPFEMLRQSREKSLIDKIIIMARVTQMKHVAKRVHVPGKQTGFRVVHELHADPNFKPTDDVIRRCKEMERIIDNVNTDIHPGGFRDASAIAVDQELTYDRKSMVIATDRTGKPIRWHLIDGTTVRPVLAVLIDYMRDKKIQSPDQAAEQYYRQFGVDLTSAAYVQIVDGIPVASWTSDQMAIDITNPSVEINKWAYGAGSMLEQSIAATVSWLNAWSYNDGLFNQDAPESLLMLYGDYDPIGLGAFRRQVLDDTGSGDYQRVPVVTADAGTKAELLKIRELPKDIQFPELMRIMIQLKTAAYRAHPSIVNFSIDKGSGGGMTIGDQSEDELVQAAKEEGFETLCHSFATWLTRVLVKPRYDDLVMIYDTDTEDEKARIELIATQQKSAMTFNEARRAQGLTGELEYGDVPDNPNYIQWATAQMNLKAQQEQQQAMAAQAGQPGGAQQGSPKPGAKPQSKTPQNPSPNKAAGVEGRDKTGTNGKTAQGEIRDPQKVQGNDQRGMMKNENGTEKVLVLEFVD